MQLSVQTDKPPSLVELRTDLPVITNDGSAAHQRFEQAFDDFRRWFPRALCYMQIVPVDEVVTLTLFHREDEPLRRLMLDEAEAAQLDRLWAELHFVSHDALTLVDAFDQLMEFATQDSDPELFEPYRKPIHDAAAAFRQDLIDAEPRAIRRACWSSPSGPIADRWPQPRTRSCEPLSAAARRRALARRGVSLHAGAKSSSSPAFLYRLEEAPAGQRCRAGVRLGSWPAG